MSLMLQTPILVKVPITVQKTQNTYFNSFASPLLPHRVLHPTYYPVTSAAWLSVCVFLQSRFICVQACACAVCINDLFVLDTWCCKCTVSVCVCVHARSAPRERSTVSLADLCDWWTALWGCDSNTLALIRSHDQVREHASGHERQKGGVSLWFSVHVLILMLLCLHTHTHAEALAHSSAVCLYVCEVKEKITGGVTFAGEHEHLCVCVLRFFFLGVHRLYNNEGLSCVCLC